MLLHLLTVFNILLVYVCTNESGGEEREDGSRAESDVFAGTKHSVDETSHERSV